jgi:nucleotide-binding universal stress UspA family protein
MRLEESVLLAIFADIHANKQAFSACLDFARAHGADNKHIDRLVALRHWAQPLKLDDSRLTVHVLEAVDPAAAILEFAEVNHVDHIVIGARQNSLARTLLGSVSAKVAAEAACSVTVV